MQSSVKLNKTGECSLSNFLKKPPLEDLNRSPNNSFIFGNLTLAGTTAILK